MATAMFTNQSVDADSAQHVLATDITTIVAQGAPWGRSRLVLFIETSAASGVFEVVPDWEMKSPGSKNVIANGAAGQAVFVRLIDAGIDMSSVTVNAN